MTVLVPIRHEDQLLEERLLSLLHAARSVRGGLLLAPDARASEGDLAVAGRLAARAPDVAIQVGREPGKFSAVRNALAGVDDGVLVLADADVIVDSNSLPALVEPLENGTADVCAARVHVAKPTQDVGLQGRVICAWEAMICQAWHILRTTHRSSAWALPGQLYAMRVSMFPSEIPVATMDDGCIGLHLQALGAEFAYVPSAAVWHPAPRTYLAWIRRKFRYRRGWARLRHIHRGAIDDVERDYRASLRAAARGRGLGRALIAHFEVMRLAARIADLVAPVRRADWQQTR